MLRLNNVIRLRYLAFILGWMGYASGLHAAALQLESTPLFLTFKVESNLVFMIDDSASMNWEVLTEDFANDGRYTGTQRDGSSPSGSGQVKHRDNDDDGIADCSFGTYPGSPLPAGQSQYGYAYGVEFPTNGDRSPDSRNCNTADDAEWRFRNHNFNSLYFNPNLTYLPWVGVDAAGNPFQDMNIHAAKDNPYDPNSRTIDLTLHNSKGDRSTSNRTGNGPDGFRYYTWTDANGNGLFDDGEETVHFIKDEPNNYQNFANWFSYYRKREYVVKAAYGDVLATMSNVRVGLVTLHNNANTSPFSPNSSVTTINTPLQSIDFDAQAPTQQNTDLTRGNRRSYLDTLYSFHAQSDTPLRATLKTIGDYLENKSGRTLFPNDDAYLTSANGGACQQSFLILMTDGLENGPSPQVGNTDIAPGADAADAAFKQGFNGGPYGDNFSNSLADVAMHYYQRDLRPGLNDIVPTSLLDQARHQHMVTYTITFDGFNGSLTRDPFPNEDGLTFWPQRLPGSRSNIDDLRHAAFNGRGQFFQANDAASLSDALRQALISIAQRTSSASSVALNTGARTASTRLFQARFDSGNWSGQILSIKLDPTTGAPLPNAQDTVDSGALLDQLLRNSNYNTSVRTILTYKPSTGSGIPFTWSELDPAQQAALDRNISGVIDNLGQARLAYVRGSNADEGQGNRFRMRVHRLGDIIDADPFFVSPPALPEEVDANFNDPSQPNTYVQFRDNPTNRNRTKMLLVGSNDGMLHIFNANNPYDSTTGQGDPNAGQELLAYVPNSVLKHTVDLTSPTYRHQYYVNGSPTGGDVFLSNRGWRTVAVGGLGAGGQGYFALDITSPSTFREDPATASNIVLWEFTDADDPELGFTFSQPSLVRMKNGQWAAVVGNGYNNADSNAGTDTHISTNGHAMFFVLFLDGPGSGGRWVEGVNYIKIDTGVGDTTTPNGLAAPAAVDIDADFTVDYLVAGDLRGNVWRIDVTSPNPNDWKQAANRALLFTATDSNGTPQPITSRPEVGKHPDNLGGFVVYVGTGKYLERSDNITVGATTQTFYGIWDKDLLGAHVARSDLLEQTVIAEPTKTDANGNLRRTRVTSDNAIDWQTQRGFFLDLLPAPSAPPAPGEKQVSDSVLRSGRIIFSTLIPNDQPCNFGGTSFIYALDVHGGARLDTPFFDINGDRLFNDQDKVTVNGQLVPFNALESDTGIVKTPVFITDSSSIDLAATSGSNGSPSVPPTNRSNEPAGRQAWRKITQ